ncbi:type II toxin-antitoxin system RelE/ParE family toxin [Thiothrix winogradskyi]|uniref:Type II toxin-antitoxin system RelE/ParE family toxin n=1 Tax=Thiothrix winogradskyi TaxID=96472 RepID=A0ABY3SUP9_9GAMM|nr:type II toxin-antitoxin system RelE/ParE family toxin [Thiothrix winogradskyi]UJS22662.1 type II toxin-antitoxin system RelE/ParE family toxin [Thiothrix winogradskyi]
MIISFIHKGLERFYLTGSKAGIQPEHAPKLRRILTVLETAQIPDDMDLPGYRLHPLQGNRQGTWSVRVSGNWLITFQFTEQNVELVDYEDYH